MAFLDAFRRWGLKHLDYLCLKSNDRVCVGQPSPICCTLDVLDHHYHFYHQLGMEIIILTTAKIVGLDRNSHLESSRLGEVAVMVYRN